MSPLSPIPRKYYLNNDVIGYARDLLGKKLCTRIDGEFTCGIITETEAYAGVNDRGSHAFGNRRTRRTETMYQEGGKAYIYLCYGIHALFNVVTGPEGNPLAVLSRGIFPLEGISTMRKRRKITKKNLADGPGKLTQALGITTQYDRELLTGKTIWLEPYLDIPRYLTHSSARIGIDYAGEDAKLPYRFYVEENQMQSLLSSKV